MLISTNFSSVTKQTQLERASYETGQLLKVAEILEKEAAVHAAQKLELSAKFAQERQNLLDEIARLRVQLSETSSPATNSVHQLHDTPSSAVNRSPRRTQTVNIAGQNKSQSKIRIKPKQMTLKQVFEHIGAIYASKDAFNEKCEKQTSPQETMRQHINTYFNTKYGLKSLVVENEAALLKAVERHSQDSNDIAVFQHVGILFNVLFHANETKAI